MIYLDHAASSSPKPESVLRAIAEYFQEGSIAAGRGNYRLAEKTARLLWQTRTVATTLFGASNPEHVIFCYSGTDALNTAIQGYIQPGSRVLTTLLEHNSVLRCLNHLHASKNVEVKYLEPEIEGRISLDKLEENIQLFKPDHLISTHASNVSGIIQPVHEMGELCRKYQISFIVDAAQTAGHIPICMKHDHISLLATSAHKGLLGPLGTGLLILGDIDHKKITPLRYGGTGSQSESAIQPETLPDRFEAGNLNVPGIIGLNASLNYLAACDLQKQRAHEAGLLQLLISQLAEIDGVRILEPSAPLMNRIGLISLVSELYDPQALSQILDVEFGIAVRAGLHCAPLAHQYYGTFNKGGTLRVSIGHSTSADEIMHFSEALGRVLGKQS